MKYFYKDDQALSIPQDWRCLAPVPKSVQEISGLGR